MVPLHYSLLIIPKEFNKIAVIHLRIPESKNKWKISGAVI